MPAGRETKLTPETQKAICDAIAAGNYDYVAAEYAGVGRTTFYAWLAKGEEHETGIHREFLNAIKRAASQAEVRNIAIIETDQSWQSKAWWLERKHNDRWGKKETHTVGGDPEKPIEHTINLSEVRQALSDPTVREALRGLAQP